MTLRNSVVPVTASTLTGMTLNQVAFGNSTGGLQGSANLTFNGSTLTLTGAQSISGQLTSTVATGTAPFVVASTTAVANLNASLLLGGTWASPAAIGSTAPAAGTFSTLTINGDVAASGKFLPNNSVSAYLNGSQAAIYGSTGSGSFPFNQSGNAVIEARGGANPRAVVLASAGGSFTAYLDAVGTFNVPSTTPSLSTTTGALVVSGGVAVGGAVHAGGIFWQDAGASDSGFVANSNAGTNRSYWMFSNGAQRWRFFANDTAEAGANAGSDFQIAAYDDSSVLIDLPLTVTRAAAGTVKIASGRPFQLGNAYVATPPTCTGYVTVKDSTGTTYKLLCAA